ncbi:MAG: DNA polymerase III subunit gamma/tau [Candidatus Dormibacteria bacterium]
MTQSLYRRHRSPTFAALIGQDHVTTTLRNQVIGGAVSHGYLFTGIRGTGKTSAARILARAVNCLDPHEGEPCNTCESCTAILEGRSMDVIEIDAASNRGIDEMRSLRERVHFLPAMLRTKVYIIDEAHMLTTEAWNAFLKTLEEPPDHVVFVLATTEPQRVPETVRSRVQRFDFRRLSLSELTAHVEHIGKEEGRILETEAADVIARAAHGSARDALSLLEYVVAFVPEVDGHVTSEAVRAALGLADPARIAALVEYLATQDAHGLFSALDDLFDLGVDPRQIVRQVGELVMACARASLLPKGGEVQGVDPARLPASAWVEILDTVLKHEGTLRYAPDPRSEVEFLFLTALVSRNSQETVPGTLPAPSRSADTPMVKLPDSPSATAGSSTAVEKPRDSLETEPDKEPGPQAAGATLGKDLWKQAVERVQRMDAMLAGIMRDCTIDGFSQGTLTIRPSYAFHYQRLNVPEKRNALLAVLSEMNPDVTTIEIVFNADEAKGPTSSAPLADEVARQVTDLFPGSQITKSRLRDPSLESSNQSADRSPSPAE